MSAVAVSSPPVERAEDSPANANPLLEVFEAAAPALLGTLLIAQLQGLRPGEQTSRWIDELLADPRLDSVEGARAEAVRALLDFGYPWALAIPPDDLERFRNYRVPRTGRWGLEHAILGGAAALAMAGAGSTMSLYSGHSARVELNFIGLGLCLVSAVWGATVLLRASFGWQALARWIWKLEVPLALAAFAVIAVGDDFRTATGLIAAALPLGLAAGFSEWLSRRRR